MAGQNKPEPQSTFSIDEFIGEIEKAEAETLNKRLPQERLRNKRALDNAARRAAEAAATGTKPLVPQKLQSSSSSSSSSPLAGDDLPSPLAGEGGRDGGRV